MKIRFVKKSPSRKAKAKIRLKKKPNLKIYPKGIKKGLYV